MYSTYNKLDKIITNTDYSFNNKIKRMSSIKNIDSKKELEYLTNGGILPYVLNKICGEENSQNLSNL